MKIKEFIKKNYLLIIISIIFLSVMTYTSLQAPYASDDFPYSLFYRGDTRITNVIQILKNQVADYRSITGRIFTNGLGQFLLMMPRIVFSIGNAIVILLSAILTYLIIKEYSPNKKINKAILPLIIGIFFIMNPTKHLVYWIMGSANYIWTAPLLLFFIWYTTKYGLFNHPILTALYIGFVSSTHESLLVFYIIYIASRIILDKLTKEKWNKYYWLYILMIALAAIFIFISPGNRTRNATWYPEWNDMNLIERLTISIPTVAKKMFGMNSYYNLIPLLFMVCISINLIKKKDSFCNLLAISNVITFIMAYIINDGWLYLLFSIILFISENYGHFKEKNYSLIITSLSFYAIVYSMILTPEYGGGRPNYFMYWYMALIIGLIINKGTKCLKLKSVIIILIMLMLAGREVYIYNQIGEIVNYRMQAIEYTKKTHQQYVYHKKIPDNLSYYVMEANTAGEEDYWAKQYFTKYYGLSPNTIIVLID